MEKRKILFSILSVLLFSCAFLKVKGQSNIPIPTDFFGQNAWMPDSVGTGASGRYYGKLDTNWAMVKASNVQIIRYGGKAVNINMPSRRQYLQKVDSIKNRGMVPVIQVPYLALTYDTTEARMIVKYINTTMGRNVKYWIIGNEPDLNSPKLYAITIAPYIQRIASVMKNQDPSIKIIGPELAYVTNSGANWGIIDTLTRTSGAYSIMGNISGYGAANGKAYVDYFSWHVYSHNGTKGYTGSQAKNRKQLVAQLAKDSTVWGYIKRRLDSVNTVLSRSSQPIKPVITEANICWNDSGKAPDDVIRRFKGSSFFAGQHWAEMVSYGLATGVQWINFWAVMEGNEISYMKNTVLQGKPKSTYRHIQKMGELMKGTNVTYYIGKDDSTATPIPLDCKYLKSFGSNDGCTIAVFVLNQDTIRTGYAGIDSTLKIYTISLNDTLKGTTKYRIKMNMGKNTTYVDTIEHQSTTVLLFDCTGGIARKYRFRLQDSAIDAFLPYAAKVNPSIIYSVSVGADQTLCCPGCTKTYTATVSPTGGSPTYQWYKNGTLVAGATNSTYAVGGNANTTYTIKCTAGTLSGGHGSPRCYSSDEALLIVGNGSPCDGPEGERTGKIVLEEIVSSTSAIQSLVPNPAENQVSVYYTIVKGKNLYELKIINSDGRQIAKYRISPETQKLDVDCTNLSPGIYFTSLLEDGKIVSTKKLVIAK